MHILMISDETKAVIIFSVAILMVMLGIIGVIGSYALSGRRRKNDLLKAETEAWEKIKQTHDTTRYTHPMPEDFKMQEQIIVFKHILECIRNLRHLLTMAGIMESDYIHLPLNKMIAELSHTRRMLYNIDGVDGQPALREKELNNILQWAHNFVNGHESKLYHNEVEYQVPRLEQLLIVAKDRLQYDPLLEGYLMMGLKIKQNPNHPSKSLTENFEYIRDQMKENLEENHITPEETQQ